MVGGVERRLLYDCGGEAAVGLFVALQEKAELQHAEVVVVGDWRVVLPGEAFPPGHEFRMDLSTGEQFVLVEKAGYSVGSGRSADGGEDLSLILI